MSDIYLTRLKALRDIGFPLAKQMEHEGRLDFEWFMSECGTYGCLLGWWATTEYARNDGWRFENTTPCWGEDGPYDADDADNYFDISLEDRISLFGGSEEGTLEYRKIYLEHLIAKRELSQN